MHSFGEKDKSCFTLSKANSVIALAFDLLLTRRPVYLMARRGKKNRSYRARIGSHQGKLFSYCATVA